MIIGSRGHRVGANMEGRPALPMGKVSLKTEFAIGLVLPMAFKPVMTSGSGTKVARCLCFALAKIGAPVLGLPRQCERRIEVCLQRFISRSSTISQTIDATLAKSKARSLEPYRAVL